MPRNVLLIVEGSKIEQRVLRPVFERYGFTVSVANEKLHLDDVGQFQKYQYSLGKNQIVIIQGPRNRIHDFLKLLKETQMPSIERAFAFPYGFFSGIFLIYDVDHNDELDVEEMARLFGDESSGMLLLSSPCFEVIGDYETNRGETKYSHLSEYKADINAHYEGKAYEIMSENFSSYMLRYLDKNHEDFQEDNVMEHPCHIVTWINENNERRNLDTKQGSYVFYRYFSTVVYVAIAFANGLTKEINNYSVVREFFAEKQMLLPF